MFGSPSPPPVPQTPAPAPIDSAESEAVRTAEARRINQAESQRRGLASLRVVPTNQQSTGLIIPPT